MTLLMFLDKNLNEIIGLVLALGVMGCSFFLIKLWSE